MKGMKMLL